MLVFVMNDYRMCFLMFIPPIIVYDQISSDLALEDDLRSVRNDSVTRRIKDRQKRKGKNTFAVIIIKKIWKEVY